MMTQEKKKLIFNAIESYTILKGLFTQFKEMCTGFLAKENAFKLGIQDSNDVSFKLTAFDSTVFATFSMVLSSKDTACGKITFERLIEDDDNEEIWVLYFDHQGNLRESLAQKMSLYNMTDSKCFQDIILNFLDNYLHLPCFKADEGSGISTI